jgi:dienelactone hydrolase
LTIQEIRYSDGGERLKGLVVRNGNGSHNSPGILVVHGGAGLDSHAEQQARRFAALGYVAFACDMYGEAVVGHRDRILACIGELRADRQRLCRRAQAGLDVLATQPQVDRRIAVVGYCFGGLVALEVARGGMNLDAVVSVHGSLTTTQAAQAGTVKARILACHGARDPYSPPPEVSAFIAEMNQASADWQLVVYGGAMHGFTHQDARGQTPGVLYDAQADRRSSADIRVFLEDALGASKVADSAAS